MQFKATMLLQLLPLLQLVSAVPRHTTTTATPAAGTSCAPGAYISVLANFNLQLPYGSSPTNPTTIEGKDLAGCNGYQNSSWFYWDSAGGYMVMKAPPLPSGASTCAHTSGSKHCRTELREENPSSWSPTGTNTMTVALKVPTADDGDYGTVIGQVFSAEYSKPVAELFYNPAGTITIGVEQTTAGGHSLFTKVGSVPEGKEFTYELSYTHDVLGVSVNGGALQTFPTSQLGNPKSYFKVGDYDQGQKVSAEVDVYSIKIVHNSS
jgi:hypothetical protein